MVRGGGESVQHAARLRARAARERSRGSAAAPARDPAERFAERDIALRAFSALGERDREALRLVAWEGLALAGAARAAGVSRAAFAMRLHRARRRLAAHLRELDSAIELERMERVDA